MKDEESALAACRSVISQCKTVAIEGVGKAMEKLPQEYDEVVEKFRAILRSPRTRQLHDGIRRELAEAVQKLGGDEYLLAIIGSLGEVLTDEQILVDLRAWNDAHPKNAITPARYAHKDVMENAVTVASLKAKPQRTGNNRARRSRRRTQNRRAVAQAQVRRVVRSRRQRTRNRF